MARVICMETSTTKAVVEMVKELSQSYGDVAQLLRGSAQSTRSTKQLWRAKNKSTLIKVGLALIAFPDPTISDMIGTALVAVGTVQAGIRHRTLYVEDVFKSFQKTFRELHELKQNI